MNAFGSFSLSNRSQESLFLGDSNKPLRIVSFTTPGFRGSLPIGSMYGIFTYIWLICMVDIGKCTIHGSYGLRKLVGFGSKLLTCLSFCHPVNPFQDVRIGMMMFPDAQCMAYLATFG